MSFCRFGYEGNSEVYVYEGSRGIVCCSCAIADECHEFVCDTPDEMIDHLREHVTYGYNVPYAAVMRLEACKEE